MNSLRTWASHYLCEVFWQQPWTTEEGYNINGTFKNCKTVDLHGKIQPLFLAYCDLCTL